MCHSLSYTAEADQFSSYRRGAGFPKGVHWCATKGLTDFVHLPSLLSVMI